MKNRKVPIALQILIVCLVGIIALFVIGVVRGQATFDAMFRTVTDSFLGVIIAVIIGGAIVDALMKSENYEQLEGMLNEILHNKNSLEAFRKGKEKLEEIMLNSMKVRIGEKAGELIFNTFIQRYINVDESFELNCRTNYSYEITLNDSWACDKTAPLSFDGNAYYGVLSEFEYTRKSGAYANGFNIFFVYDQSGLESTLESVANMKNCFFREVLTLTAEDKEKVRKLTKDELMVFVNDVLGLTILIAENKNGDKKADFNVSHQESWGFCLQCKLSQFVGDITGKLIFKMPYSKEAKNFLVLMPDPTLNPKITFITQGAIEQLDAIALLTQEHGKKYDTQRVEQSRKWKVIVDGWVFPTSGVVFTWK